MAAALWMRHAEAAAPSVGGPNRGAPENRRQDAALDQLATLQGTTPVDVQLSRQVSWLAVHRFCPAFPVPVVTSDAGRQQLAAHSCGGSTVVASNRLTGLPLSSPPN